MDFSFEQYFIRLFAFQSVFELFDPFVPLKKLAFEVRDARLVFFFSFSFLKQFGVEDLNLGVSLVRLNFLIRELDLKSFLLLLDLGDELVKV